jgi:hypothetical protein
MFVWLASEFSKRLRPVRSLSAPVAAIGRWGAAGESHTI